MAFEGRVALFDDEVAPLYNRPALSKEMLSVAISDASETPLVRTDVPLDLEFGNPVSGIGP